MSNASAMYGAVVRGDLQTVSELIAGDRSILEQSTVGKNWLHWAAQRGHIDVMEFLVSAGIPVDGLTDDACSSALDLAAGQGQYAACKWLIDRGADINRGFGATATPVFSAIYSNSIDVVKLFVTEGADLNAVFGDQEIDVVSYAERFATPEIVAFLRQCKR